MLSPKRVYFLMICISLWLC